jgi:hypothetical protein
VSFKFRDMGAKHSLEDDLITFKLTSKQFNRDGMVMSILIWPPKRQFISGYFLTSFHIASPVAKRCDKNEALQRMKLKKAIEQVGILVRLMSNKPISGSKHEQKLQNSIPIMLTTCSSNRETRRAQGSMLKMLSEKKINL